MVKNRLVINIEKKTKSSSELPIFNFLAMKKFIFQRYQINFLKGLNINTTELDFLASSAEKVLHRELTFDS